MYVVSAPKFAMLARKVAKKLTEWMNAPAFAANARKVAETWQATATDSRNPHSHRVAAVAPRSRVDQVRFNAILLYIASNKTEIADKGKSG